jgi:regulatory protein YycI of two-component signal transduction system YycFG
VPAAKREEEKEEEDEYEEVEEEVEEEMQQEHTSLPSLGASHQSGKFERLPMPDELAREFGHEEVRDVENSEEVLPRLA